MIRLNSENCYHLVWNLWQSFTRQGQRSRMEFTTRLEIEGISYDDMTYALAEVAKFLRSPNPVVRARLDGVIREMSSYDGNRRIDGLTEFFALLQTTEPPLPGLPAHEAGICTSAMDCLSRASGQMAINLQTKIFVVQDGERWNPFEVVEGSEDESVVRLEDASRLNSLAQRIGTHFLKTVWTVIQAGLTEHLSKSLNLPSEKVEAALRSYASDRGL